MYRRLLLCSTFVRLTSVITESLDLAKSYQQSTVILKYKSINVWSWPEVAGGNDAKIIRVPRGVPHLHPLHPPLCGGQCKQVPHLSQH